MKEVQPIRDMEMLNRCIDIAREYYAKRLFNHDHYQ